MLKEFIFLYLQSEKCLNPDDSPVQDCVYFVTVSDPTCI